MAAAFCGSLAPLALVGAAGSADQAFVALGVLSAAGSAEKSNAAQYRSRRMRLRHDARTFPSFTGGSVAIRFVLAGARTATNGPALEDARREAVEHGDVLLLNMTEGRFTCSRKYLLWLRAALRLFPRAAFISMGDDDVYIQLDHLFADLKSASSYPSATRYVVWGLIMWKAYYNNATMVTSTGFTGWGFTDWAAVAQRTQMEACRDSRINASKVCPGLREDHIAAARSNHIGSPPFPIVNGPLFALSRDLAAAVAQDAFPPRWISALVKTPRIAAALARPGGLRRSGFACWPVGDSILGYWVLVRARSLNKPVTLINTPLMKQHHPWPSSIRGRFSNYSIVLHGLKSPEHERFRELAISRGSGPFEPIGRECGTCKDMGWSTWPDSPVNSWRCCGSRIQPQKLKLACRGRLCPQRAKVSRARTAARPSGGGRDAAGSKPPSKVHIRQTAIQRVKAAIGRLEAELIKLRSRTQELEK